MTKNQQNGPEHADVTGKAAFVEPAISEPVDVVSGNPAATSLFAIAGSGYVGLDGGTNPSGDGGALD